MLRVFSRREVGGGCQNGFCALAFAGFSFLKMKIHDTHLGRLFFLLIAMVTFLVIFSGCTDGENTTIDVAHFEIPRSANESSDGGDDNCKWIVVVRDGESAMVHFFYSRRFFLILDRERVSSIIVTRSANYPVASNSKATRSFARGDESGEVIGVADAVSTFGATGATDTAGTTGTTGTTETTDANGSDGSKSNSTSNKEAFGCIYPAQTRLTALHSFSAEVLKEYFAEESKIYKTSTVLRHARTFNWLAFVKAVDAERKRKLAESADSKYPFDEKSPTSLEIAKKISSGTFTVTALR